MGCQEVHDAQDFHIMSMGPRPARLFRQRLRRRVRRRGRQALPHAGRPGGRLRRRQFRQCLPGPQQRRGALQRALLVLV